MAVSIFDHLPDADGETNFQQTSFVIKQCIEHNSLDDAVFLSEMLHERVGTDDSMLLYCDCLLRSGRTEEVYHLLFPQQKNHPRLRYLFAKCCFDLKKYDECERALIDDRTQLLRLHDIFEGSLSAPFASCLLAMVLCQTGRVDLSRNESAKSIQGNPFLWSSICKYLQVGGKDVRNLVKPQVTNVPASPKKVIKPTKTTTPSTKKTPLIGNAPPPKIGAPRKAKPVERNIVPEARRSLRIYNQDTENAVGKGVLPRNSTQKIMKTPSFRSSAKSVDATPPPSTINRKARDAKPLGSRSANAMRSLSSSTTSVASSASQPADNVKESESNTEEIEKPLESVLKTLYEAMQHYSEAEESICKHQWTRAIELLGDLPFNISKLSIGLLMRARVLFEMSNYESAKDVLMVMREKYPHKIEGMELLSTALWQLQDSHALSALAQELTVRHRRRPQTWCAVGNCFSLQRQNATAIECMERAIVLDPHFVYAHTLLGHELIYLDELDKAAKAFRRALNIAPNDYRAWHGLGQVHQRNEQLHLAQANMKKAVDINPTNRGILCTLAQVEQQLGHPEEAMKLLTQALVLNPNDVACRYNKARLLYDMKKEKECLEELNKLKELSPDEAHIFHLLGKVHRRLENMHKALLNYSWATEMDPRGEQMMAHGVTDNYSDDSYSPEQEDAE